MAFDSIRSFFNIDDDDDYMEDSYEDLNDYEEEPVRHKTTSRQRVREEYDDEPKQKSGFLGSKPKVVSMNRSSMEVKVIKPHTFDPDDAQRIMDFISGCIYAINGKYHQISKYIFIFSPENVDISGDSLSFDGAQSSMPVINREF